MLLLSYSVYQLVTAGRKNEYEYLPLISKVNVSRIESIRQEAIEDGVCAFSCNILSWQ